MLIDSSKRSLKCGLLHNSNMYVPISIGNSTTLKEKYKNCFATNQVWTSSMGYLCRLKNGELFVGSAEWVHEVSLLSAIGTAGIK